MDIIILKNALHNHTGLFRIMKFHFKCSRGGTKSSRGAPCPPLKKNLVGMPRGEASSPPNSLLDRALNTRGVVSPVVL